MNDRQPLDILEWYAAAGADEAVAEEPADHFAPPKEEISLPRETVIPEEPGLFPAAVPGPSVRKTEDTGAAELARQAQTLEELRAVMEAFDGCPLKETASHMVFGAGKPQAQIMIIGEAPGAEEDRRGEPFVGVSGRLLDLMLKSIGLSRDDVYISNILPWRPPGNRKPSEAEVALFTPFIRRHIALVRPKILLLLGGSAVSALMHTNEGITRCRGRWMEYADGDLSLPAMASFHPAFLLRTPAQKKMSWRDFLALRQRLDEETA